MMTKTTMKIMTKTTVKMVTETTQMMTKMTTKMVIKMTMKMMTQTTVNMMMKTTMEMMSLRMHACDEEYAYIMSDPMLRWLTHDTKAIELRIIVDQICKEILSFSRTKILKSLCVCIVDRESAVGW